MKHHPRPYQLEAHEAAISAHQQGKNFLYVAPTGTGKTHNYCMAIETMLDTGRAMVLVHTKPLVRQAYLQIGQLTGIMPGVEVGAERADVNHFTGPDPIVVSTYQTQISGRKRKRREKFAPGEFSGVILDEAHRTLGKKWREVPAYYAQNKKCWLWGCTATPNRTDEQALGQIFDEVHIYRPDEARRDGWIVPLEAYPIYLEELELNGVKKAGGDFVLSQLNRATMTKEVIAAIADGIRRHNEDRKTLLFAPGVESARMLAAALGDRAACIDGETAEEERRYILSRFKEGEIRILTNCNVFLEGWNEPTIECIAMCRMTLSTPLHEQMLGRGVRPLPGVVDIEGDENQLHLGLEGESEMAALRRRRIAESAKPNCLILDFIGNCQRHVIRTCYDALGGKYSDDVIETAKKEALSTGKKYNVEQHLEQVAERKRRETERIAMMKQVQAKTRWKLGDPIDPYAQRILNNLNGTVRESPMMRGRKPTEKMVKFLVGQKINSDGLTFAQAGEIIGHIKAQWSKPPSERTVSPRQAKHLDRWGFRTDLTMEQAKPIMDTIASNGWRWPAGQEKPQWALKRTN